jgi:hypothetical protein
MNLMIILEYTVAISLYTLLIQLLNLFLNAKTTSRSWNSEHHVVCVLDCEFQSIAMTMLRHGMCLHTRKLGTTQEPNEYICFGFCLCCPALLPALRRAHPTSIVSYQLLEDSLFSGYIWNWYRSGGLSLQRKKSIHFNHVCWSSIKFQHKRYWSWHKVMSFQIECTEQRHGSAPYHRPIDRGLEPPSFRSAEE